MKKKGEKAHKEWMGEERKSWDKLQKECVRQHKTVKQKKNEKKNFLSVLNFLLSVSIANIQH